jgi:acyl transferase domain-containing protein
VQAPREAVEAAIADIDGVLIANHNAPTQSIISGSRAGVAAASAQLAKAGHDVTEIPVAAAFHSSLVKPAQRELAALIDATPWKPTRVPVYSNTTARPHAAEVAKTRKQMAEHLVRPVEFVSEIEAMYQGGARIFLEVGPKAILSKLTAKILGAQPHHAIAVDDGSGLAGLLGALGSSPAPASLSTWAPCTTAARAASAIRTASNRWSPAPAVPKHAWMLNGSYARRADEPQRQIGVTVEQVTAAVPAPAADPPRAAPATASTGAP